MTFMVMKPLSVTGCSIPRLAIALGLTGLLGAACTADDGPPPVRAERPAAPVAVVRDRAQPSPPFTFSPDDQKLLDEVQRGAFNFLWNAADPATGMVVDRSSAAIVSVAGVGFQLSAIPIGVERGWVTRDEGEARAKLILSSLKGNPTNRKSGLFYHYLDGKTASATVDGYEHIVSTIDSALLFAGMITASSYFGGEVAQLADSMVNAADWSAFVSGDEARPSERGFISLGWKPDDQNDTTGTGALLPFYWVDSGDEHRLVTFLAVAAPNPEYRVSGEMYYRLRRRLGTYADLGPFVWFPWSGALFTSFFSHCWIDYAAMGPDEPARFGVEHRARVDWWENSRRTAVMHRLKAIDNPKALPGLGKDVWGINASDAAHGYAVPGLFPVPIAMPNARPEFDFATHTPDDDWGDGTIAPYSAGCSIMFEPRLAIEALRRYRTIDGLWSDPASGGYGFRDAFQLGTGWIAPDYVAIDQGPLILAIENARTGLIWRLFHEHPVVKAATQRLKMSHKR